MMSGGDMRGLWQHGSGLAAEEKKKKKKKKQYASLYLLPLYTSCRRRG